jgi:hypothetical protein
MKRTCFPLQHAPKITLQPFMSKDVNSAVNIYV